MALWTTPRSTVEDLVRTRFQHEEITTTTFLTRPQVSNWLYWGADKIMDLTNCFKTSTAKNLVSGTADYTVPSTYLALSGVRMKDSNSNWYQVEVLNYREHRALVLSPDPNLDETGTPGYATFQDSTVGTVMTVHPTPNYSVTGGIEYFGAIRDNTLTSTTNTTFLKPPWIGALVEFVAREAWLKYGNTKRAAECDRRFYREVHEMKQSMFRYQMTRHHVVADVEYSSRYPRDITGEKA